MPETDIPEAENDEEDDDYVMTNMSRATKDTKGQGQQMVTVVHIWLHGRKTRLTLTTARLTSMHAWPDTEA